MNPISLRERVVEVKGKDVGFQVGADGGIEHCAADGKGEEAPSFIVKMAYISPNEVTKIITDAGMRRVVRAKGRAKAALPDAQKAQLALCEAVVKGWTITAGSLRNVRRLNLAGLADGDPIPFSAENLRALVDVSGLGDAIAICLDDDDFWFPGREAEEGNSSSGASGSSPGSAAQPALTTR